MTAAYDVDRDNADDNGGARLRIGGAGSDGSLASADDVALMRGISEHEARAAFRLAKPVAS